MWGRKTIPGSGYLENSEQMNKEFRFKKAETPKVEMNVGDKLNIE
jgi:hypothetical protein